MILFLSFLHWAVSDLIFGLPWAFNSLPIVHIPDFYMGRMARRLFSFIMDEVFFGDVFMEFLHSLPRAGRIACFFRYEHTHSLVGWWSGWVDDDGFE